MLTAIANVFLWLACIGYIIVWGLCPHGVEPSILEHARDVLGLFIVIVTWVVSTWAMQWLFCIARFKKDVTKFRQSNIFPKFKDKVQGILDESI